MKTILIYPKLEFSRAQIPTPPYSILFIADYLISRGVEVKLFDLRFDSQKLVLDAISETEPEYIGVSVMTGPQISHALKICKSIKSEFNHINIVWGGIHSTILPSQTLQNSVIDIVNRGEGEKSYYELVSGNKKSQIAGLSIKKDKKIFHNQDSTPISSEELNSFCIPWSLIDSKRYIKNGNLNFLTSRGCPFQCAFCYNTFFNFVWRGWTAEKCIEEIDKAINLGAKNISFYDDNFFANKKRIEPLFNYFKQKNINWKAELRVDMLNKSLAEKARDHGCIQMFFGVESGSQRILNILNKKISIKDILNSAEVTKNEGIVADYSWMIGIPGEEKRDIQKTISLVKKVKEINPECEFSIKILYPYPKTPIFDKAMEVGFIPPKSLQEWGKIRRDKAPPYLKHKEFLETISLTSAVMGRKVFEQDTIPILKLIRKIANFRWKRELFVAGFETFYFNLFRTLIEKFMNRKNSIEYDPFAQEFISIK